MNIPPGRKRRPRRAKEAARREWERERGERRKTKRRARVHSEHPVARGPLFAESRRVKSMFHKHGYNRQTCARSRRERTNRARGVYTRNQCTSWFSRSGMCTRSGSPRAARAGRRIRLREGQKLLLQDIYIRREYSCCRSSVELSR